MTELPNVAKLPNPRAKNRAFVVGETPWVMLSGEVAGEIAPLLEPTAQESRQMLAELRERWPRSYVAAVLGAPVVTVRMWESGQRNPCGVARRLIWFVHARFVKGQQIETPADFIVSGEIGERPRVCPDCEDGAKATKVRGGFDSVERLREQLTTRQQIAAYEAEHGAVALERHVLLGLTVRIMENLQNDPSPKAVLAAARVLPKVVQQTTNCVKAALEIMASP